MRLLASVLLVALSVGMLETAAAASPDRPDRPLRILEVRQGQAFCPASVLVTGGIIIQPGRCYTLFLIRDGRGAFLGFGPPAVSIPPGQIVRLSTPAGAKAKNQIIYWVPLQTTTALLPVNTITPVAVRLQDSGKQVILFLTGVSAPNITLVFKTDLQN